MSLQVGRGERLALVGENGAGKSTLMNVLYGLYQPDAGELLFDGVPVRLKGPKDALARGVGMVHQHFMLVPSLTVAENVVLGREPTSRGFLDMPSASAQVKATAERFGFSLDPGARVDTLTVGSQQKVEIVKALHRGAKVLILDEPTAVLTPQERDELFRVARSLSDQGHTVVFIGHKLQEVLSFADRVAVMRRGRLVAEVKASEASADALADLMVGATRPAGGGTAATSPGRAGPEGLRAAAVQARPSGATPRLQLDDVHARGALKPWALQGVSLRVYPGELVGIAGVDGNGQSELAEVLTGLRPWARGALLFDGEPVRRLDPASARALGIAHVPEDRLARAMVAPMSVEENLALGQQRSPPFARGPWLDRRGRREAALRLVTAFDVRPPSPGLPLGVLSGGNQQKVVLARELSLSPKLLVAVQPTRGLDIAAVAAVHERLLEAKQAGAAVLLVSLDLDEVLKLADRAYVLASGRVTLELSRGQVDERRIGQAMLGQAHA